MKYTVTFEGFVVDDSLDAPVIPPAAELESFLDAVMDIVLESDVEDATCSAVIAQGKVEISLAMEAEDSLAAQIEGGSVIRAAAHGAGAATPDWAVNWCTARLTRSGELVHA